MTGARAVLSRLAPGVLVEQRTRRGVVLHRVEGEPTFGQYAPTALDVYVPTVIVRDGKPTSNRATVLRLHDGDFAGRRPAYRIVEG